MYDKKVVEGADKPEELHKLRSNINTYLPGIACAFWWRSG